MSFTVSFSRVTKFNYLFLLLHNYLIYQPLSLVTITSSVYLPHHSPLLYHSLASLYLLHSFFYPSLLYFLNLSHVTIVYSIYLPHHYPFFIILSRPYSSYNFSPSSTPFKIIYLPLCSHSYFNVSIIYCILLSFIPPSLIFVLMLTFSTYI